MRTKSEQEKENKWWGGGDILHLRTEGPGLSLADQGEQLSETRSRLPSTPYISLSLEKQ